jgi:hypothetical protein
MPIYQVRVGRVYELFEEANLIIEAPTAEEASAKAVEIAATDEDEIAWLETGGEYKKDGFAAIDAPVVQGKLG